MRLRVKGARILTQNAAREQIVGDVLVEDGRIAAVGDVPPGRVDETLEARGMLLLPGLINAHTHLPMSLFRGYGDDLHLEDWLKTRIWPAEDRMTEEDMRVGSRLAALEMIGSGSTAFNDMYFFEDAIADEMAKAGLRGWAGFGMVDVGKVAEHEPNPRLPEIERFVKKWSTHPRVRGAPAPHAVYTCGPETYRRSLEIAQEHDSIVHTHAHETRTEVYEVLRTKNARPLTFLKTHGILSERTVLAHCGWITKEEVRTISTTGAAVVHCPVSNMKLATGGKTPVPELMEASIDVGLGTDGAASNNTLDLFETMKVTALLHKHERWDATVLPAQAVLDMATRGGAAALRLDHLVGSIEVGKRADFILVDPRRARLTPIHDPVSHLIYAARGDDVHGTVVDGEVLKWGDEYRTLRPEAILDDAQRAASRLVQAEAPAQQD